MSSLAPDYAPQKFELFNPFDARLVERVRKELSFHALLEVDGCYGYFPDVASANINHDLPHSQVFADSYPTLKIAETEYSFSFLRIALQPLTNRAAYHLDGTSGSGLAQPGQESHKPIRRALINLSRVQDRAFRYLDRDISEVTNEGDQGYKICNEFDPQDERVAILKAYDEYKIAHGIIFCASKVLHRGVDEETYGHFVASYGLQA